MKRSYLLAREEVVMEVACKANSKQLWVLVNSSLKLLLFKDFTEIVIMLLKRMRRLLGNYPTTRGKAVITTRNLTKANSIRWKPIRKHTLISLQT